MMTLIFATNNDNKVREINALLPDLVKAVSLKEAGIDRDIPEPYDTLEENALTKARTIHELTGQDCFSEDTGLFVRTLNGEPGVRSARYADGEPFDDNIDKLLSKLSGKSDRRAEFRTVMALILDGREYLFEGHCPGEIIKERKGNGGFGYDPVFIPDGSPQSFAEMSLAEKNQFSHRKKALYKMISFLETNYGKS